MRVEALLRVDELTKEKSKTIISALKPDDVGLPEGVTIEYSAAEEGMLCKVSGKMDLGSLKFLWEDLLLNLKVALDTLDLL
ncbi:MAG: KEOPS complex subunit Pcc1 [Candidatus Geothermarchaeales archaeon]